MKILLYDKMQLADVDAKIKSPALSDIYLNDSYVIEVEFDSPEIVDCIGIGNTDSTEVSISDGIVTQIITLPASTERTRKYQNGLYLLNEMESANYSITFNGTFIGRIGIGEARKLGTNPTKEIGFYTTSESRVTLSGQTIPGAGGYSGRRAEMDVRYKIDDEVYNDLELAYEDQISREFPYFIYFDDELHKLPVNMTRFYAATNEPLSLLQSSIYRFLYSYKFSFYERF